MLRFWTAGHVTVGILTIANLASAGSLMDLDFSTKLPDGIDSKAYSYFNNPPSDPITAHSIAPDSGPTGVGDSAFEVVVVDMNNQSQNGTLPSDGWYLTGAVTQNGSTPLTAVQQSDVSYSFDIKLLNAKLPSNPNAFIALFAHFYGADGDDLDTDPDLVLRLAGSQQYDSFTDAGYQQYQSFAGDLGSWVPSVAFGEPSWTWADVQNAGTITSFKFMYSLQASSANLYYGNNETQVYLDNIFIASTEPDGPAVAVPSPAAAAGGLALLGLMAAGRRRHH